VDEIYHKSMTNSTSHLHHVYYRVAECWAISTTKYEMVLKKTKGNIIDPLSNLLRTYGMGFINNLSQKLGLICTQVFNIFSIELLNLISRMWQGPIGYYANSEYVLLYLGWQETESDSDRHAVCCL